MCNGTRLAFCAMLVVVFGLSLVELVPGQASQAIPYPGRQATVQVAPVPAEQFIAKSGRNHNSWTEETPYGTAMQRSGGYADIVGTTRDGRPMTRIERFLQNVKDEGGSEARVWLFTDVRNPDQIFELQGGLPLRLRPEVLQVTQAIVDAQARTGVRVLPVLFDFHILNGIRQEGDTPTGEHPEYFTDEGRSRVLAAFDEWFARFTKQFDRIEGMNEPENVSPEPSAGVDYNPHVYKFLRQMGEQVRRHGGRFTVGVNKPENLYRYQGMVEDYTVHIYTVAPGQLPPAGSLGVGDARIWITEVGAKTPEEVAGFALDAWSKGYAGISFWAVAQDGFTAQGLGVALNRLRSATPGPPLVTPQPAPQVSPALTRQVAASTPAPGPIIDLTDQGRHQGEDWYIPLAGRNLADAQGAPAYVLEFEIHNPTDRSVEVQPWFKDPSFKNVYAFPVQIPAGQTRTIRFNPARDRRNVDEFKDFRRVEAVGFKVWGQTGDQPFRVRVVRARLISLIPTGRLVPDTNCLYVERVAQ